MIIRYSDNNENRIEWQHREGEEWKTAELHELIEAYEKATEPGDAISRKQAIAEMHLAFGSKPAVHAQAVNVLKGLPSVEKTGKWIKKYRGNYVCSACGAWYKTTDEYGNIIDGDSEMKSNNYCFNCGARMKEESNG